MRKQVLNIFTVVALCFAVVSCKKEKEAETSIAEAVAVSESTSQKYVVNVEESIIEWTGFKPTGSHSGTINIDSVSVTEINYDFLALGNTDHSNEEIIRKINF